MGNAASASTDSSTSQSYSSSAIGPGRMRETSDRKGLPSQGGVYRYTSSSGSQYDIGVTNNLHRRAYEHTRDGKLQGGDRIQYSLYKSDVTRHQIGTTEQAHIRKHNPDRNRTIGGNGNYKA